MTEAPIVFQIPEPIYVTMMIAWLATVVLGFLAGYFHGRCDEGKRRNH